MGHMLEWIVHVVFRHDFIEFLVCMYMFLWKRRQNYVQINILNYQLVYFKGEIAHHIAYMIIMFLCDNKNHRICKFSHGQCLIKVLTTQ